MACIVMDAQSTTWQKSFCKVFRWRWYQLEPHPQDENARPAAAGTNDVWCLWSKIVFRAPVSANTRQPSQKHSDLCVVFALCLWLCRELCRRPKKCWTIELIAHRWWHSGEYGRWSDVFRKWTLLWLLIFGSLMRDGNAGGRVAYLCWYNHAFGRSKKESRSLWQDHVMQRMACIERLNGRVLFEVKNFAEAATDLTFAYGTLGNIFPDLKNFKHLKCKTGNLQILSFLPGLTSDLHPARRKTRPGRCTKF